MISTNTYAASNGDEVTVILHKGVSIPGNWTELRVWDNYEGSGGGCALYTLEAIDNVITMLNKAREGMVSND